MNIVYLNYYYDKDILTPEELLSRYWSSTEWCKAVSKAGASRVSLVQRFHKDAELEQDGVKFYFISDEFPNKLPPFAIPKKVHETVCKIQPEIIHHNGWSYPLTSLRTLLPKSTAIVWQHHGGGIPQWYSRPFYRKGFSVADGFFFTSEIIANQWQQKKLIDFFKPIYEIIESSSTFSPKDKLTSRSELRLQGNEIFLWVGRLVEKKDPLTVLEGFRLALPSLYDPHLYMIFHEQPLLQKVKSYIQKFNLDNRVHLIGKIDRGKLSDYYSAADYFILGSHSEGSGYSLLEALACSVTPIVTNIPSFRKILSDGNIGHLWKVCDPSSCASAILSAVKQKHSPMEVRKYFDEHLSFDQLGKRACEAYQTVYNTKNSCKKKIAILVPGGIDRPDSGLHLAPLTNLVGILSETFDIHVYCLIRLIKDNKAFYCGNAKVKFLQVHPRDYTFRKYLSLFKAVRNGILNHRYQLLHGFWGTPTGVSAVVLGKLLKIPSVVSLMGGETANIPELKYGNMRSLFQQFITRWTCNHADRLIVLTSYQKKQLQSFGIHRTDIKTIPIGSDKKFFNGYMKREIHSPIKFLHIGSLNKVKNQDMLLETFKKVLSYVDAELDIVGPDYLNGALQQLASTLGLNGKVRFHGMVNHNEIGKFYEEADLMLHTSIHEAQGIVVAEAASSGVVVCGTKVGLISDFSPDKSVAVEVGDSDGLANEVVTLLKNPDKLSLLRSQAYQWAKEHDLDWTVNQISKVYDTLTQDNIH